MNFFKNKNNKGFSMVEMIIYLAIMTIITITLVQSFIVVLRSNKTSFSDSIIRNSGYSIMENIIREARDSQSFSCSSNNIEFIQSNNNVVRFSIDSSGIMSVSEGINTQVNKGPLNNSDVTVYGINCYTINTSKSKAIKFSINLNTKTDGRDKNENFYSTVILRSSY